MAGKRHFFVATSPRDPRVAKASPAQKESSYSGSKWARSGVGGWPRHRRHPRRPHRNAPAAADQMAGIARLVAVSLSCLSTNDPMAPPHDFGRTQPLDHLSIARIPAVPHQRLSVVRRWMQESTVGQVEATSCCRCYRWV